MFCYIFSVQLKKPQSGHRMKKSHKVKKHKERFNCCLLIFFQLWDKSLIQAECLSYSPVGAEEMHTWNTSWNCFRAPGLSPQPIPSPEMPGMVPSPCPPHQNLHRQQKQDFSGASTLPVLLPPINSHMSSLPKHISSVWSVFSSCKMLSSNIWQQGGLNHSTFELSNTHTKLWMRPGQSAK